MINEKTMVLLLISIKPESKKCEGKLALLNPQDL